MGRFTIDLDVGLENVQKLLAHAENRGITDFGRLLAIYHNSTGLAEKLDNARADMELEEHLNSPQAQEDRERYRRVFGHQEEPELLDIPCYKILMGTDGPNLKETAKLYDLTEAEQELLLARKRGHALFMVGAKRLHISFEIPDYKMMYMGKAGGR